jgi:DNA-binding beta-propeller fold protein YncE
MSSQTDCRWVWRLAFVFAIAAVTALGGEVSYSTKPTASRNGEKTKIDFAVSAPTDVEVAVLGADGAVVRHLAAGVLGAKNPPPLPLKEGLAQSVEWDGKDDAGKTVPGPVKVRVRAGMSVKFGKIIGTSPYTGEVGSGGNGAAVAPDGTLYVKMTSAVGDLHAGMPWQLRRFDKTGKYQKTVLPYPPSTPPDKTSGFHLLDAGDGLLTPGHNSGLDVVLFNFGSSIYSRVVDGNVIFVDPSAKLTFFKVDGSNATKTVSMRSKPEKLKWSAWLSPQMAFSPDGKYAYYSNLANTPSEANVHPSKMDPQFPQGRIYRQDLTRPGSDPEKFYDLELPDYDKQKYWLPNAWNMRTAAAGVDVDAKGNIFVCDLVNQEVLEISPDGKKLSATKVPWPDKVMVSSKTGTLYVLSCSVSDSHPKFRANAATMLKVTGRGADAKVTAKLPLKGIPPDSIALDDSGAAPILWLGGGGQLVRVEDRGAELADGGAGILNADKNVIDFVCYGAVDTETEQVFITSGTGAIWRYSGDTGEGGRTPLAGIDLAVGPSGQICVWPGWSGVLKHLTRDFKSAPLSGTGNDMYGNATCRAGRGNSVGGLGFDSHGRLYITNGCNVCLVQVYEADGKLIDYDRKAVHGPGGAATDIKTPVPALITGMVDMSGSVRADAAGNAYVLQIGVPKGHVPPKGFEKDPAYLGANGTIFKFGPKGGEFQKGEPVGALKTYNSLCGPISGNWNSTGSCCHCTKPRFDVDPYGRLYIPNGWTYKVTLVDNSDNQILSFGGYGNWDAQGPASSEPKPEIPLGWPVYAGASDKYIYVGDALNHRVVRADKKFALEQTVDIK